MRVFQLFPDVACEDKGPRLRVEGFVAVGRIQLDFLGLVSELLQDFHVVQRVLTGVRVGTGFGAQR